MEQEGHPTLSPNTTFGAVPQEIPIMAGYKKLVNFEAPERASQQSKYDWDEILSGDPVFLQEKKDYDRDREAMKSAIRVHANKRGLATTPSTPTAGDACLINVDAGSELAKKHGIKANGIIVQVRPGTDEEKAHFAELEERRKQAVRDRAKDKREKAKAEAGEAAA
jgi:hypothetical protein